MNFLKTKKLIYLSLVLLLVFVFSQLALAEENKVEINFTLWAPAHIQVVMDGITEFEKQYPDIKVNVDSLSGSQYKEVLVTKLVAGAEFDVIQMRDEYVPSFVEAGWIVPLDDFPGIEQYKKDLSEATIGQMSWKGKLYGLPYYQATESFAYIPEILIKAGYAHPPKTYDELLDMAIKIKEKQITYKGKVIEYPICTSTLTQYQDLFSIWANLVYAFKGERNAIFDKEGNPAWGEYGRQALQWLYDAIYTYEVIDKVNLALSPNAAIENFSAGRGAFFIVPVDYYFPNQFNNPELSKIVGEVRAAPLPTGNPDKLEIGLAKVICRSYAIAATSKHKEEAWKLLQFLGGKDKFGEYNHPKRLLLTEGLTFAYLSLWNDPEAKEAIAKRGFPEVSAIQNKNSYPSAELLGLPWSSEWQVYAIAQLNGVLVKQKGIDEALNDMEKKAKQLAAESKGW
jgi:multiple sugar transport system substrate-binding protein